MHNSGKTKKFARMARDGHERGFADLMTSSTGGACPNTAIMADRKVPVHRTFKQGEKKKDFPEDGYQQFSASRPGNDMGEYAKRRRIETGLRTAGGRARPDKVKLAEHLLHVLCRLGRHVQHVGRGGSRAHRMRPANARDARRARVRDAQRGRTYNRHCGPRRRAGRAQRSAGALVDPVSSHCLASSRPGRLWPPPFSPSSRTRDARAASARRPTPRRP